MKRSTNNLPVQTIATEADIKMEKIKAAWKRQHPNETEEDWRLYYESLCFWTDAGKK